MNELQELIEIPNNLVNPRVESWKKQHKKVIGFFCSYVPEEIPYALQLLPYRVRPLGCNETARADAYMSTFNCSFARCCLELALKGNYEFLDGLVFMNSCDHIHRLCDVWRYEVKSPPFIHFLNVPRKINDSAIAHFRDQIVIFTESLEKAFGVKMTEEALRSAIEIYNETRSLLREVYELRKSAAPPITGAEVHGIVLAASTTPKEEYNKLLKKALKQIKVREDISTYKARVMILGSNLDDPNYVKLIEDQGALVVADALCFGSRYFRKPVEIADDLLYGLAKSYLERPMCPRMIEEQTARHNHIKEIIRDYKVDGVIFQTMRYCDIWGNDYFRLSHHLKECNVPILNLQREYMPGGQAQLITRVQAFLEVLGR